MATMLRLTGIEGPVFIRPERVFLVSKADYEGRRVTVLYVDGLPPGSSVMVTEDPERVAVHLGGFVGDRPPSDRPVSPGRVR